MLRHKVPQSIHGERSRNPWIGGTIDDQCLRGDLTDGRHGVVAKFFGPAGFIGITEGLAHVNEIEPGLACRDIKPALCSCSIEAATLELVDRRARRDCDIDISL